jgi:hypothetical protein
MATDQEIKAACFASRCNVYKLSGLMVNLSKYLGGAMFVDVQTCEAIRLALNEAITDVMASSAYASRLSKEEAEASQGDDTGSSCMDQ